MPDNHDRGRRESAAELGESVSAQLKKVGVDTDVMADSAREKASELGDLIAAEVRKRPLQALGIAAFVGFVYGLTR